MFLLDSKEVFSLSPNSKSYNTANYSNDTFFLLVRHHMIEEFYTPSPNREHISEQGSAASPAVFQIIIVVQILFSC